MNRLTLVTVALFAAVGMSLPSQAQTQNPAYNGACAVPI